MLGRSQVLSATPKRVPATKAFTMRPLWRLALWGATAAGALLIAVFASRSEVGSQRVGVMLASLSGGKPTAAVHSFDAEAETRKLSTAMRGLAVESGQLAFRVTAVERNMEDVTGSITRQIEAVKTAVVPPWPTDEPPTPTTPAVIASVVTPVEPQPAGLASPLPPNPLIPAAGTAAGQRRRCSAAAGAIWRRHRQRAVHPGPACPMGGSPLGAPQTLRWFTAGRDAEGNHAIRSGGTASRRRATCQRR